MNEDWNNGNTMDLVRQFKVLCGVIVAATVFLGYFYSGFFLFISFSVAVNCIYAGVTGDCRMTKALGTMPWNQNKS